MCVHAWRYPQSTLNKKGARSTKKTGSVTMSLVIKVVKANVWVIWIFCNRSYPKKKWIANGFKPQAHKASISLIIQAWFTNIQLVSYQQAWLIWPLYFHIWPRDLDSFFLTKTANLLYYINYCPRRSMRST